jgi:hypothetical protein
VGIKQHRRKRLALLSGLLEQGEPLLSTLGHGGPHLPAAQRLLENASVGGIIVDHQHGQVAHLD